MFLRMNASLCLPSIDFSSYPNPNNTIVAYIIISKNSASVTVTESRSLSYGVTAEYVECNVENESQEDETPTAPCLKTTLVTGKEIEHREENNGEYYGD
jgi:hypothetical protein